MAAFTLPRFTTVILVRNLAPADPRNETFGGRKRSRGRASTSITAGIRAPSISAFPAYEPGRVDFGSLTLATASEGVVDVRRRIVSGKGS
jgi:hypothetical protein